MKIRNFVIFWLSRIILNLVSPENKPTFRRLEYFEKKKISVQLYSEFNQMCLKENLLPNTYVCVSVNMSNQAIWTLSENFRQFV